MENFIEDIELKGHVVLSERKFGEDWKKVDEFDNVITSQTKRLVINYLQSGTGPFISHFGIGSGTIAESAGDSDNLYPVDITSAGSPHKVFDSVTNNGQNIRYSCILLTTEPSVQPVTLSELALFSALSGGSCFTHVTHTGYPKTNGIELRYDYTITVK